MFDFFKIREKTIKRGLRLARMARNFKVCEYLLGSLGTEMTTMRYIYGWKDTNDAFMLFKNRRNNEN